MSNLASQDFCGTLCVLVIAISHNFATPSVLCTVVVLITLYDPLTPSIERYYEPDAH